MYARRVVGCLVLGAMIWGCAEERPAVNRVQPLALEKTLFLGPDLQSSKDDPEFWSQATLIDVGYGASQDGLFTSTYAQPVSRMRWQITEDLLIGRLAYERVENTDGRGLGKATQDGMIVAAFRIEKHFDVVRAYNPTTGEQLNIVEENASDRPWYERAYMRVDWSKNLNTDSYDFDTLSLLGVYGGFQYEPLAMDVTDPDDPNAPYFDDLKNGYFDITSKAFAKPQMVDLSSFGIGIKEFPACFLPGDFSGGTGPQGSCSPAELTIRHSFRRVVDNDYEPQDWDGFRFQAFGAFTEERQGYTRNYGMSDEQWRRFITRYNLWERSHFYQDPISMTGPIECYTPSTTPVGKSPHRDENQDGTEDECAAAGTGSRCDPFRQRCTLPYAQRTAKPVAWYYTSGNDLAFFEATDLAAHEWDVALRVAVRTAQYAECNRVGGTDCSTRFPVYFGQQDDNHEAIALAREVDDCRRGKSYLGQDCMALAETLGAARGVDPGVVAIAKMPEMLVVCHSPVEANDPAICGEPRLPANVSAFDCAQAQAEGDRERLAVCQASLTARRGDLRFHQVNVIENPQTKSPWGIYTDSEDPLTGEKIAASINVWSSVNVMWSQMVIDRIRLYKGELKSEDVTGGNYVNDWVRAADAADRGGSLPRLSRAEFNRQVAEFAGGPTPSSTADAPAALAPGVLEKARLLREDLRAVTAHVSAPSVHAQVYEARRKAARGTEFEASLLTPMMQQLAGVVGLPISEAILDLASPLRGASPGFAQQIYNLRQTALARRGACVLEADMSAAAPLSISGLASVLEAKFGKFNPGDSLTVQLERAERMRDFIARRAHTSVIMHEMGHSIGMRHNFVSSSDAWQYRPQYWQLRTKNGKVKTECSDLSQTGEDCVGPRYFDPVTDEERENLIWMFMNSSVMEYPGEVTQDFLGLGVYDFAATRMFYGDAVAVSVDSASKAGSKKAAALLGLMDNFGGILGFRYVSDGADIHYSQLQTRQGLINDCQEVDPTLWKPATWKDNRDGTWHPVLDGLIVKADGKFTRCRQPETDFVSWDALRLPSESEVGNSFYRGGPAVDLKKRVRMPYGFGSDEWADVGNLSVYRHDNGADAYEIFNYLITLQELDYIFDNFRRGRSDFSVRRVADRQLQRYNAKLRDGAKGIGLYRNIYNTFGLQLGFNPESVWPVVANMLFADNIIASSQAFDHFARTLARPEAGDHFFRSTEPYQVLRSVEDSYDQPDSIKLSVPLGASGSYDQVGFCGKLVENRLSEDHGDYNREYTMNAGSYYEKLSTAMLMTESVDNFISASRTDFTDPRYRSVSLADLFPEGYRRWLGTYLAGDDLVGGVRVAADEAGDPIVEAATRIPAGSMGWVRWWGDEPQVCFPAPGTTVCSTYADPLGGAYQAGAPSNLAVVDPQVGWEQQKFLIAWTLLYLPENQKQGWLDQLRIWELGRDADPGFANRIEFHNPTGRSYVAKTSGKESLFGKVVQKGVAARMLEAANGLLFKAYETEAGPDLDGNGQPDWYLPKFNPETGQPMVLWDSGLASMGPSGYPTPTPGCDEEGNAECTCSSNRFCLELERYVSVLAYLREAVDAYRLGNPDERGIYQ